MTEEDVVIICVNENDPHTKTSIRMLAHCGHTVWVSGSAMRSYQEFQQKATPVELICIVCWGADMMKNGLSHNEEIQFPPGALDELARDRKQDLERFVQAIKSARN